MLREKIFRSKALSLAVTGSFLLLLIPMEALTSGEHAPWLATGSRSLGEPRGYDPSVAGLSPRRGGREANEIGRPLEGGTQSGSPSKLTQAPASTGALVGFIYGDDLKTPVENAVVKIRNIENAKELHSAPTDASGLYRLKNIPEGRYILGVSTKEGNFNFEYMLLLKANEVAKLSLALKPGITSTLGEKEREKKKPFFLTPLGIAIIIVGSAIVIYGTYKLLQELEIISPSKK